MSVAVEEWLADNQIALHSEKTRESRRYYFARLYRFFDEEKIDVCDSAAIRRFFATVVNERTGAPISTEYNLTLRRAYNAFWTYAIKRGIATANPLADLPKIPKVKQQAPQRQTFSPEQLDALERAIRKSLNPKRDLALFYFALDTGLRATEMANVRFADFDLTSRSVRVVGKGDKERQVWFSAQTLREFWNYWRERGALPLDEPDDYAFVAVSGETVGEQMTRWGISSVVRRLCKRAGITDGKSGVHRMRHTCATELIRNGAYQDSVQQQLGHSDPKMTQIYVTLASADLQRQHAMASPVMTRKKKRK